MLTKYFRIYRRKQILREARENFGKSISKNRFHSSINILNEFSKENEKLFDEKTWDDLEMDDVFSFIDRTYSKTGEQYLYKLLHEKQQKENFKRLNLKVDYYQNNFNKVLKNIVLLNKYSRSSSYTLPTILYGTQFYKIPNWVVTFVIATLLLGLLSIFYKVAFIIFIVLGVFNTFLHYYFKRNINSYFYDFSNLKSFFSLYIKLSENDNETGYLSNYEKNKLKTISRRCSYLTMNIEYGDELTSAFYYLLEIIKGWFLIDVIQFNHTLKLIELNSSLLQRVFNYIGLVDTAISITSVKKGSKGCKPKFIDEQKISIKNAYHPLVKDCIANSIFLNSNNAIITGGNMSGKTTFLKTIGINIILSQTINFSFSDHISTPQLSVLTSITINDDLEKGQSYFMNELHRAKETIEKIESRKLPYLILLDEIFKGTNSKDRIALGSSMLNFLSNYKCFVLATTHDLAILDFIKEKYNYFYFDNSFINDKIVFDFRIRSGVQNNTNVIELLKSLNFTEKIISDTIKFTKIIAKSP